MTTTGCEVRLMRHWRDITSPQLTAARAQRSARRRSSTAISCHSVAPGEDDPQGPNLLGIVGRRVATREGFTYSPALHDLAAREPVWTEALLDRFITDPLAVAPRTRMRFAGLRDSAEREALIIVLRTTGRAP